MKRTELKTCPFCGGDAQICESRMWINGDSNGGHRKYIQCVKCACRTMDFDWDDRDDMIDTWNGRVVHYMPSAESVIRCKDCKHHHTYEDGISVHISWCDLGHSREIDIYDEWFCADAKPKEGEEE